MYKLNNDRDTRLIDRFAPIFDLSAHAKISFLGKELAKPFANSRIVIQDQDAPNHASAS
jgi:hypothetical protein